MENETSVVPIKKTFTAGEIEIALDKFESETKIHALRVTVNGAIASIPKYGGALLSMLNDLATKRLVARIVARAGNLRHRSSGYRAPSRHAGLGSRGPEQGYRA